MGVRRVAAASTPPLFAAFTGRSGRGFAVLGLQGSE